MARSRVIKPGLFQNEFLAELPFETRLLFAGLPCYADREGRLEDRPKRIKMMLFPADDVDIDAMLDALSMQNFIQRYEVDNIKYIQIVSFKKHQKPHAKEQPSTIPSNDLGGGEQQPRRLPAALVTCSSSLLLVTRKDTTSNAMRFDAWWKAYPKKVEKKKCLAIWKRRKLDGIADKIIEDTQTRPTACANWQAGFIPNPQTYLNGDRWEDEFQTRKENHNGIKETPAQRRERSYREALAELDEQARSYPARI